MNGQPDREEHFYNNKMACFNDPTPRESLCVGGVGGVGWVADSKNLDQLWELDQ